jgi:5-methyltetrahydropteroyltriglutamate--homocysteine methyltransferase
MHSILQAYFSSNAAALASRKSSPRVTNEAVQKAVSALQDFNSVISVFGKF